MRINAHVSILASFIIACLGLTGCGGDSELQRPETGSVQQFLDENPDYQEASDLEVATEEEEFDVAGAGE